MQTTTISCFRFGSDDTRTIQMVIWCILAIRPLMDLNGLSQVSHLRHRLSYSDV